MQAQELEERRKRRAKLQAKLSASTHASPAPGSPQKADSSSSKQADFPGPHKSERGGAATADARGGGSEAAGEDRIDAMFRAASTLVRSSVVLQCLGRFRSTRKLLPRELAITAR
jgi:hypothetical protein